MKVVTFGELMIRLQPFNYERFVQANNLEFTFGGGEANVAVSLANYGMDAVYVTKLPAHAIGQAAINSLRRYGVDTSKIVRGGDRVGIYFNEKGASQRGSVCIYDRAHSAIQEASTADFDWDSIFEGVDWFHFTGITPALGPNVVDICREACKAAKAHGVKISCDLNYRGKLWTRAEAREAMSKEAVNVMLGLELGHIGINCADEAEAAKTAETIGSLLSMAVKPGNSSIFVGKKEFEIMKKPGRGTHGHIAILTNNVDRAIYHLGQRGVKFDMDSKNVKDGKTVAIYFADEIAGFAFHLVQR